MKKLFLLFVVAIVSISFAAGGTTPTKVVVDAGYEVEIDTLYLVAGLITDSLSGADSLKIRNDFRPTKGNAYGWEHILACRGLDGDSAANAIVQVYVDVFDSKDSLISHSLIDTIPAAGGYILFPFGHNIIGTKYDIFLKSLNANDHVYPTGLSWYKRRPYAVSKKWQGN